MLTFLDYATFVNECLEKETVIEISCDGKHRKFLYYVIHVMELYWVPRITVKDKYDKHAWRYAEQCPDERCFQNGGDGRGCEWCTYGYGYCNCEPTRITWQYKYHVTGLYISRTEITGVNRDVSKKYIRKTLLRHVENAKRNALAAIGYKRDAWIHLNRITVSAFVKQLKVWVVNDHVYPYVNNLETVPEFRYIFQRQRFLLPRDIRTLFLCLQRLRVKKSVRQVLAQCFISMY